jgi:Ca2+-binding RTX toxin-like protein
VAVFHGTKHDDTFNESSDTASDTFDLAKGGEDTATGGSGDDVFNMGASLDAGDRLDGGGGRDVVNIHGDYSAGLVFDDQTIQNIEVLRLGAGFDYSFTMADGNVASGAYLTIDASALGRANHLTFDGSLESDGHYLITDGAGNDVLTGGALADKFRLMNGGSDTVHGGAGDDVIVVTAGSPSGDTIDGGTGNDTLTLGGHSGSVTLDGSDNVTGIETLSFQAGNSYTVTIVSDITDGGGKTLTVDGSALGASDTMTVDLSGATSAAYAIHGGAGGDTVTFGSNFGNTDEGFGTTDTVDGGAGGDTLIFTGGLGTVGLLVAPPLEMDSGTLTSVETIDLQGTDDFHIQLDNGNIAAGATLTIDSTGTTGEVVIDAGNVAVGSLHFIAGAGQSGFIGGANADVFDLTQATHTEAEGGGGNDVFNVAGSLAGMTIEGDAGNDTLTFDGDVSSLAVSDASITGIETLEFLGGHSYTGVTVTGDIAGGSTLTIDASAASNISIDLTAATSAAYVITGSAGDDTIKGANAVTTFHLEAGGNDTVTGGSANDVFDMGGALTAADAINGGGGNTNTMLLDGDYSAGLTFGATTVTNVETIDLAAGHDYNITINAATLTSFGLTVDGSNLGAGDSLTVDASAAARHITLIGGAGDDVLTGGTARTTFDISHGGDDIVHSTSLDSVQAGAALTAADTILGSGSTSLELNGDYSAGVTTTNVTGVNRIEVDQGHSYDLTLAAATVTAGHELTMDSNSGNFDGSDSLTVDASQVGGSVSIDSEFASSDLTGGSGDDTLSVVYAGQSANTLNGGGGDDVLTFSGFQIGADDFADGGTGNDTLDVQLFSLLSSSNVTDIDSVVARGSGGMTGAITGDITGGKGVLTIEIVGLSSLHLDLSAATSAGYSISTPGSGPDTFVFAGNLSASDVVDGGGSDDTLELNGDYSAGLTFGATTIADIDTIKLDDGFSYKLTMNAIDTFGNTQTIDASALGATHTLTFDGSAEANKILVEFGAGFTAADSVIGGSGSDTLQFNGNYASLALSTAQASSIETLTFLGNHSYTGVTVTGDIADGSTLTINAGAASNLSIDLSAATSAGYAITGSGGADTIKFAGNFSASDTINGGAGADTLELNGEYSSVLTLGATTLTNIETIKVDDGHSYDFVSNDATVASGATLTVDASALTGSNQLFFDGSTETNGHFAFIGGAGDDDLEGGSQSDTFDLSRSDGANAFGNGGNDIFTITSAAKLLDDSIDGGTGSDTLVLNGDFHVQTTITASNVENIETLQLLGAANSYNIAFADAITTALTVDASAAASLTFDAGGDTSTAFTVTGSAGADTITGGAKADTITGGAGADTLTGGGGGDIFNYTAAGDSNTATGYDTITDLTTADSIHIAGLTPNFFAAETVSTYQGSLDADLASALSGMTSGTYAVVTLTGGTDPLDGHTFLIVDGNGTAGYTAGADYVIDITGYGGAPSAIHFI